MKNFKFFFAVFFAAIVAATVFGGSSGDYFSPGDVVTLTWSTTSPTKGDAVLKCSAKVTGGIVGVALLGAASATEDVEVATRGIFYLPVQASSTIGNISVGDFVFGSVGGLEVCTTKLSNASSGLMFGQALEAITATTTASTFETIKVRIVQPAQQ